MYSFWNILLGTMRSRALLGVKICWAQSGTCRQQKVSYSGIIAQTCWKHYARYSSKQRWNSCKEWELLQSMNFSWVIALHTGHKLCKWTHTISTHIHASSLAPLMQQKAHCPPKKMQGKQIENLETFTERLQFWQHFNGCIVLSYSGTPVWRCAKGALKLQYIVKPGYRYSRIPDLMTLWESFLKISLYRDKADNCLFTTRYLI